MNALVGSGGRFRSARPVFGGPVALGHPRLGGGLLLDVLQAADIVRWYAESHQRNEEVRDIANLFPLEAERNGLANRVRQYAALESSPGVLSTLSIAQATLAGGKPIYVIDTAQITEVSNLVLYSSESINLAKSISQGLVPAAQGGTPQTPTVTIVEKPETPDSWLWAALGVAGAALFVAIVS